MSKIINIGTALPPYRHDQKDIAKFMNRMYGLNERSASGMNTVYDRSKIDCRYSVIPDFSLPETDWTYFPPAESGLASPKLDLRMQWYRKYAPMLAAQAIEDTIEDLSAITHLVTVSCTGMSAPGIDIELIKILGLAGNIQRTSVNFMGCYAALHGLKIADAICRSDEKAMVMVACVELCTIHFQKDPTPDNIASSLLFADGAAAVLVVADSHESKGHAIHSFYSEIAMEGEEDMSWELSEHGFLMRLSSYVPRLVGTHIQTLLDNALKKAGSERHHIRQYAIHPGGKKILEATEKALSISPEDLACSYEVLKNYGNMSSVTILFVLREILKNKKAPTTDLIFTAAFGPGITIETMLLNAGLC